GRFSGWCGWAMGALAAGSACTELAPGSDILLAAPGQLGAADAGAERADPRWACLGKAEPPSAVALRPSVGLTLAVLDPALQTTPESLLVRACNRIDVDCMSPALPAAGVSSDGLVHLSLDQGFNGFLEITSPTIVPFLFFVSRPLQTERQESLNVIGPTTLQALAGSGDVVIDPTLGFLLLRSFDCQGELASGVSVSNGAGGEPFNFVDGLPNVGGDVTDANGIVGFVNVPTGSVVGQGLEPDSGQLAGTVNVVVRQGWFTYGDLSPRR
ncbi:MAG TPA: hypothetical protein VJU61_24975, partial [Polyangiaceae bacterium]|nr:hypothetical protein [Polyangiaceae bacterium]